MKVTDSMKASKLSLKAREVAMTILEHQGYRAHSFKLSNSSQKVMEMILRQRLAKSLPRRFAYTFRGNAYTFRGSGYSFKEKSRKPLKFEPYTYK